MENKSPSGAEALSHQRLQHVEQCSLRPTSGGFFSLGLHVRRAHKASLHSESQGASSHTKPWACQAPCSQDTSSLEGHLDALRPCAPHGNKALLPEGHDGPGLLFLVLQLRQALPVFTMGYSSGFKQYWDFRAITLF